MKIIQMTEDQFTNEFSTTLDKLKLISLDTGTINVNLNDQVEVDRFIRQLHRSFHYEVVTLKHKLEKI